MSKIAYTPRAAADATDVDLGHLEAAIRSRELPAHVVGDQLVVSHVDLTAWVQAIPGLDPTN